VTPTQPTGERPPLPTAAIAAFAAIVTAMAWVAHFAAPTDMHDHDQLKPAGYVLDIVRNGAWAAQTDFEGLPMSKPPLFPWLAAAIAKATGNVSDFEMYAPSGLALLIAAAVTAMVARRWIGSTAALWTVLAFVLNPLITKHLCLARADAVFTGAIACAAWSLFRSIAARADADRAAAGRWIIAFWLAATLAFLAKGPLGVLLAAGGAASLWWPKRWSRSLDNGDQPVTFDPIPAQPSWWAHALGAIVLLSIVGAWWLWAVKSGGQPLIDRIIGRELVGHTFGTHSSPPPFSRPYLSTAYFFARFAPWTIPVGIALVRIVVRPSSDARTRLAERFAWCWVVVGLVILSIPGHQRGDLLLPLWPAGALLAGQQIARFWTRWNVSPKLNATAIAATIAVGVAGVWWWNSVGNLTKNEVRVSMASETLAARARAIDPALPLSFDRSAWDMQWACRTKQPNVDEWSLAPRPCWFFTRRPIVGTLPVDHANVSWGDGKGDVWLYRLD